MAIKTVGVLGCGLMGGGIAQVSAAAGFRTIVLEVSDEALKKGKDLSHDVRLGIEITRRSIEEPARWIAANGSLRLLRIAEAAEEHGTRSSRAGAIVDWLTGH